MSEFWQWSLTIIEGVGGGLLGYWMATRHYRRKYRAEPTGDER